MPDFHRRRVLAAGGAVALLVLLAVLVWPIGVLTGGGSDSSKAGSSTATGTVSAKTQGQVLITQAGGRRQLLVSASGLPPSDQKTAYGVWLYNSPANSESLGFTAANSSGALQGGAALPSNFRSYRFVDISREPINSDRKHSGNSVLRGLLQTLKSPITRGSGRSRVTILANIRLLPLPSGG